MSLFTPECLNFTRQVPGYFDEDEILALAHHVEDQARPVANIVEIGVEYGRSASIYLQLAKAGLHLNIYLVDNWCVNETDTYRFFCGMVDKHFRNVRHVLVTADSLHAEMMLRDHRFHIVHIDGNHIGRGPLDDMEMWCPKLVPGGVCAVHDYRRGDTEGVPMTFPDVDFAVDSYLGSWQDLGTVGTLALRRKPL